MSNLTPRSIRWAAVVASLLIVFSMGASAQPRMAEKARFELVADRASYAPGSTVKLAARVTLENHWHVNSHQPSSDNLVPTELRLELPPGASTPSFEYPPHKLQKFEFADDPIAVYDGRFTIIATFRAPTEPPVGGLTVIATLQYQACDDRVCLPPVNAEQELELTLGENGPAINSDLFAVTAAAAPPAGGRSLLGMLLLAMLGGLILNAMPCVLPVLSLKIFGLVKSAGQGRSALVMGSLATTFGILVSFWALALVAIVARAAGAAVGWGVQFQHPGFVAFLAVVVVLFSLNLWGLFEIPLPQSLARAAGTAGHEGLAGHFMSGLFATLMATPCSAPFLGTAIGFALAQPAPVIFAIFTAVGIGLALPYLALAIFPRFGQLLPKPGEWMLTLRGVLGFLLAAAAVWLFYVLAAQVSAERVAFIQLTLLLLALCAWALHKARPASLGRRLAALGIVVAGAAGVALAVGASASPTSGVTASRWIDWIAFDELEAQSLADQGRLVFVDVTADWCLTCKATERLVLETEEIAQAFERHDVVAMKADWTNRDDRITAFLNRFGRSAVPFYVLYRPGQEPHAFGELLTKDRVLTALDENRSFAAMP